MTRNIFTALALTATLGLSAQTATNLVVEETNGNKTAIPTTSINGVLFEEAPEYREANHLVRAIYALSGDNATYSIDLGTDAPDSSGEPSEVGGVQVSLQLVAPQSEDRYNAILPEGYYRIGDGSKPFTININQSGIVQREEEGYDGTIFMIIMDGTVDVRRNAAGIYDIRMELYAMSGMTYDLSYTGPIDFSLAATEFEAMTDDRDVTFTGGQERFYGNWFYPFADDGYLQYYTGTFNADGQQTEGYWLNIDTYFPKAEDPMSDNLVIPDGTYVVDPREDILYNTFNPFTFRRGEVTEFMGQEFYTGTYITQIDEKGRRYVAFITEGSFTISDNGRKVEFSFVAENGIKINGTYSGKTEIFNFCDNANSEPKRPFSTLTSDRNLYFPETALAVYFEEPESYVLNYKTFQLIITDYGTPEKGDFIQMAILCDPSATELPNGTYTVSKEFGNNVILPGVVDYGGTGLLSWYGNLEEVDADGYQTTISPIYGGTMTIEDGEDGNKIITFDLLDDGSENGGTVHKIQGTWKGELLDYNSLVQPYNRPALKLRAK